MNATPNDEFSSLKDTPGSEQVVRVHTPSKQREAASLQKQKGGSFFVETLKFIALALVIVIPIRYFIAQPFIVSGSSMDPTFHDGQYLVIDEISYRFEDPERLDTVIFRYPKDKSKYFIKRVIGLPGETVMVDKNTIQIVNSEHPEGFILNEPYVKNLTTLPGTTNITLKSDEYFVMGDNRPASSDSRFWGPVPRKNIVGVALLRLSPLSKIELYPGTHEETL